MQANDMPSAVDHQPLPPRSVRTTLASSSLYGWAIIGGFLPIMLNCFQQGAGAMPAAIEEMATTFYLFWLCLGAFLSAVAAHLSAPKTALQAVLIGISAPAFLGGMVSNNKVASNKADSAVTQKNGKADLQELALPKEKPRGSPPVTLRHELSGVAGPWLLSVLGIKDAQAQPSSPLLGRHEDMTKTDELKAAVTGVNAKGWFVIVASTKNQATAQSEAQELNKRGIDTRIFEPYGNNPYYGVAVGSFLERDDAQEVVASAKQKINPDAYLWRYPNGGPKPVIKMPAATSPQGGVR